MVFNPIMMTTLHFMLYIEIQRLKLHGRGPQKISRPVDQPPVIFCI